MVLSFLDALLGVTTQMLDLSDAGVERTMSYHCKLLSESLMKVKADHFFNESSAMERHGKHMGSYKCQAQPPS